MLGCITGWAAFKVTGTSFQEVWSADIASPCPPAVANGVLFTLGIGSTASPAVLYALDGASGKNVWNSGKTIKSFVKAAGLWSIGTQLKDLKI